MVLAADLQMNQGVPTNSEKQAHGLIELGQVQCMFEIGKRMGANILPRAERTDIISHTLTGTLECEGGSGGARLDPMQWEDVLKILVVAKQQIDANRQSL